MELQRWFKAHVVKKLDGERPHEFTEIERRVELHDERRRAVGSDQIHIRKGVAKRLRDSDVFHPPPRTI